MPNEVLMPTEKAEVGGWSIKPEYVNVSSLATRHGLIYSFHSFSEELQSLHTNLTALLTRKTSLELELRRNFSAPSLKLHSSYTHGLHLRIGNLRPDSTKIGASKTAVMVGQSGSSKSFFDPVSQLCSSLQW